MLLLVPTPVRTNRAGDLDFGSCRQKSIKTGFGRPLSSKIDNTVVHWRRMNESTGVGFDGVAVEECRDECPYAIIMQENCGQENEDCVWTVLNCLCQK